MKLIPLSRGLFAKVDDRDFASLSRFGWWVTKGGASKTWYAQGWDCDRKCKVRMHNVIMGISGRSYKRRVDHRNGDGLDNQRGNLRICTHAQNMKNRRPRSATAFKGIYYHKGARKWAAEIVSGNKWHYLGLHLTAESAALAYNEAALRLHGEFARLNEV